MSSDLRLGPFALILFLAVLFNILFVHACYRAAKRRAAAREGVRATIQEATGIAAFRRESFAMALVPCALVTAVFCVPYATILLAVTSAPGVGRHFASGRQWGALFPATLIVAVLYGILKKKVIDHATAPIVQFLGRADYESALALADRGARRYPHSPRFLSLRGVILLFAGRLKDAEQALRGALETASISVVQNRGGRVLRTGAEHFLMLTNLGYVLLMQDRGREAAAAFEGAAKIIPRHWSAADRIAEVYLLHDREPQRALQSADKALVLRETNAAPNAERHTLAYIYANRARALAMLGRTDEAKQSLEDAAKASDPDFVPGMAGTLWRMGMAMLNMNRESEAMRQFQRAKEIDPKGLYGTVCAAALRDHGVRA
jgi:Tfp pilus assembly protein PilF